MRNTRNEVPIDVITSVGPWDAPLFRTNPGECSPFHYSGECYAPFVKHPTGCYLSSADVVGKDHVDARMSYDDGKAWCEKYGMHMVAPICETENDNSIDMIRTDDAWLGAYRDGDSWKSSYTDKPLLYEKWATASASGERALVEPSTRQWKPTASANESEVVCVKDVGSIDITNAYPDETYTGTCASPFASGPYGCYLFSSDETSIAPFMNYEYTRADAIALCDALNGKLATPRNEVENDYFRSKLNVDRPRMNLGGQFDPGDMSDRALYEYDIGEAQIPLMFSKYEGDRPQHDIDVSLDRDGGWYGGSTGTPVFMCLAQTDGRFQMSPDEFETSRFDVFKKSDTIPLSFPSKNRILFDTSTNMVYTDKKQNISFNFMDHTNINVFGITYITTGITPDVNIPSIYNDNSTSPRAWDLGGLKLDDNGLCVKVRGQPAFARALPIVNVVDGASQATRLEEGSMQPMWGYPWSEHGFVYYGGTTHHSEDLQSELMSRYSYAVIDVLVYKDTRLRNGGVYYRHGYTNDLDGASGIMWVGGTFRTTDGGFFGSSSATNDNSYFSNFTPNELNGDWLDAKKHRLTIRGFYEEGWTNPYTDADFDIYRARRVAFSRIIDLQVATVAKNRAVGTDSSSMLQLKEYYDTVVDGAYTYVSLARMQTHARILYDRIVASSNALDVDELEQQYDAIGRTSLTSELTSILDNIHSSITSLASTKGTDTQNAEDYNDAIQAATAIPVPHNFGVFQRGDFMKLSFPDAAEILLSTKTDGVGTEKIDLKFTDYPDTDVFGITYITTGVSPGLYFKFGDDKGGMVIDDKIDSLCNGTTCAKRSSPTIDLGGLTLGGLVMTHRLKMKFENDTGSRTFFDFPYDPSAFMDFLIPVDQATWGINYSRKGYSYFETTTHSTETQMELLKRYPYVVIEILVHGGSRERNGGVYYRHGYTDNIDDPTSDEIVYVGGTFHTTDDLYFNRSETLHATLNTGDLVNNAIRLANLSNEEWSCGLGTHDGTTAIPQRKLIVKGFPKLNNWAEPDINDYTNLQPTLDLNVRLNNAKSYFEGAIPYSKLIDDNLTDLETTSLKTSIGSSDLSSAESAFDYVEAWDRNSVRVALDNAYNALLDIPFAKIATDMGNLARTYRASVVDEWKKHVKSMKDANEYIQVIRKKAGQPAYAVDRERESLDARCDADQCNELLTRNINNSVSMYNETKQALTNGGCAYCPTRYYHHNDDYFTYDNAYTLKVGDGEVRDILGWTQDQIYDHIKVVVPPKQHTFHPDIGPNLSCENGWKSAGGKWYCELDGTSYFDPAVSRCESLASVLPAPKNEEENTAFYDHLKAIGNTGDKYWLGVKRFPDGTWKSLDGSSDFTKWDQHHPMWGYYGEYHPVAAIDVVSSGTYQEGHWISAHSDSSFERKALCEYVLQPNTPETPAAEVVKAKAAKAAEAAAAKAVAEAAADEAAAKAAAAAGDYTYSCPAGWRHNFGKAYCPFTTGSGASYTWVKNRCEELGSTLAVPTNEAENDYIDGLCDAWSCWLGVTDKETEGTWVSDIDGSPVSWTNWDSGPFQLNINTSKNNAKIQNKYWVHDYGHSAKPYICQAKPTSVVGVAAAAPPPSEAEVAAAAAAAAGTSCPNGWIVHNGTMYCPFETPSNITNAKSDCANIGATVAVPTNSDENSFINGLFSGDKWIGISDTQKEGTWVSDIDGEPLSYTNWDTGGNEPNDSGNGEDYAHIRSDGLWNDISGTSKYPYVCQKHDPVAAAEAEAARVAAAAEAARVAAAAEAAAAYAVEYTYSTTNKDYNIGSRSSKVSPTFKRTTLDECKNICNNDTNCLAFTRDTSVGNGYDGRCWFHDHIRDYGDGDDHNTRVLYTKGMPKATPPPPSSGYKLSTNDRCGPSHNNQKCHPTQCCSASYYCGGTGTTGVKSAWCSYNVNGTYQGTLNGEYDG